ncbi:MAG TPA: OmpA family protein, partial [Gammaproteobacteria bacterium]|nr:OmpA family protein [Gammaproteobacteria bacterium]
MQSKHLFQIIVVAGSLCLLTSCAAWKSGQDASSIIDGNNNYASNVQPTGLGDEASLGADQDQNLSKRTYYFDYDKSEVRSEDRPAIQANAEYLAKHPNSKVLVEGHTDPRGSREYNIALGERRAKTVEDILKNSGASASQVRVISYGAEKLAS